MTKKPHPLNDALAKLARALPADLHAHAAELTSRDAKRTRRALNKLATALERRRNASHGRKFGLPAAKAWEDDDAAARAVAHLRAVMWVLRAKEPTPEFLAWANARIAEAAQALGG